MFESLIGPFTEQGTVVFANPWVWYLLPLPLLVYFFASAFQAHSESVQVATLEELTAPSTLEASKGTGSHKSAFLLVAVIWLTLLGAAARPERIIITEQKEVPVRDLLLVLDISGSMAIRDMRGEDGEPSGSSRMDVMQKAVAEFIEKRQYDNIGLIVFGSQALPLTPLSRDHDALIEQIHEMVPGMAGPQTSIGDAIGVAIRSYHQMDQEAPRDSTGEQVGNERMMILLTDGMDTSSVLPPRVALRLAETEQVIIHTIAFGDVHAEDSSTSIDTALLKDIAEQTQGSFYEASGSLAALQQVYQEIDQLVPRKVELVGVTERKPLFSYLLLFGLLLSLVHSPYRGRGGQKMTEFFFMKPLWLIAAAACLVALFRLNRSGTSRSGWWQLMDENIARSLIVEKGDHPFLTPLNLVLIMVFAFCVALAGPAYKKQVPDDLQGKASVIVLLANSDSMYAGDVTPNRNRLAKQKIRTLVQALPGSQFGLIAYAHSAHQVSPLTSDPEFLALYLNELEPKLMPDREFRIGGLRDALTMAGVMMEHAHYPVSVLIMADRLTDEDVAAIRAFDEEGRAAVNLLAMGTENGGALRFVEIRDVAGDPETQMSVEPFTELKEQGVTTLGVSQGDDDISWLTDEVIRSTAAVNNRNPEFPWHNSGYLLAWLFLPACLLLFRKQSWLFSFAPVMLVFLVGFSSPAEAGAEARDTGTWESIWWSPDQLGQKAVEQQDYQQAARLFEDPYLKGWSLYQLGEYEAAENQFRKVDSPDAYFYLANCLAQQEKYKDALRYYGMSVEEKGPYEAAKKNIAVVKDRMARANKVSANQREVQDDGRILLQVGAKGVAGKKDQALIDPLVYSDEELKLWLEKVESSPEKLLKTKFELQSQEKLIDEASSEN